ncbi:MFS transporter [Scleromatobacter humisilvae]|uniref:MFS transporter n=1 Tax=Scleromatobacter humisilvae TaxID=2897159 RepID=A0A9X1YDN5_9BURK|nr:MFS transporter [Scleromatobacter humisilvae]MCK9684609.1 MFS transporter [Scleromatobacter humisilvae]
MSAGTFRSLRNPSYRKWFAGSLVSNIGTWVQRTAQDWLVLTQLTHHNATALGVVMALQFGPHIVLLPFTGSAADRFDRRRILIATQSAMFVLALALGLLTLAGVVALWHVYAFALLLGCVTAFDAPASQTFVSELVGDQDLSNAVGLNSTSFNIARMVGPAIAGVLLSSLGTGWAFVTNAASYLAVLVALWMLRVHARHASAHAAAQGRGFVDGLRYVASRPDLTAILLMLFLIGTFGLNFTIFISTMAVSVFHEGASRYGLLMSIMAIGTISGSLLAARRQKPRIEILLTSATVFGIGCTLAALMPTYWLFGAALMVIGVSALTFANSTNSLLQLGTEPAMRGRVMAMRLAIALGGTPIGAPIVGWVADTAGPRWALGVGAASGFAAAAVLLHYLARHRHLRVHVDAGRLRIQLDPG